MVDIGRWQQLMHTIINQRCDELRMELYHKHRQIEANRDHLKTSLMNQLEIKVGGVLTEQLQKDEVDGTAIHEVQDELDRLQQLFHSLHTKPLISVSTTDSNPLNFNSPRLLFPDITVDGFNSFESFINENTAEIMEYSAEQQIDTDERNTYRRNTCKYTQE
jgi:hypothetical protein